MERDHRVRGAEVEPAVPGAGEAVVELDEPRLEQLDDLPVGEGSLEPPAEDPWPEVLDELADATVPEAIRLRRPLDLGEPLGEHDLLEELKTLADDNQVLRSFIGMGYHDCITPPVILRNVLENPGWYTQYTPYQAEISQGRLEALLNFQTMISDLTGLMWLAKSANDGVLMPIVVDPLLTASSALSTSTSRPSGP